MFHYIKRIGLVVGIVVILFIWFFFSTIREKQIDSDVKETEPFSFREEENIEIENNEDNEQVAISIVVDIKGEVKKPGVYNMNNGSRVIDVVEQAGGFTKDADERAINLAQKLTDEMVIYVPKFGEEEFAFMGSESTHIANLHDEEEKKVRINDATSEQLQTLQGIGPAKAEAIIQYREEHGPFQQLEDLLNVSGIGEKTLEQIKDAIIVP